MRRRHCFGLFVGDQPPDGYRGEQLSPWWLYVAGMGPVVHLGAHCAGDWLSGEDGRVQ